MCIQARNEVTRVSRLFQSLRAPFHLLIDFRLLLLTIDVLGVKERDVQLVWDGLVWE